MLELNQGQAVPVARRLAQPLGKSAALLELSSPDVPLTTTWGG